MGRPDFDPAADDEPLYAARDLGGEYLYASGDRPERVTGASWAPSVRSGGADAFAPHDRRQHQSGRADGEAAVRDLT
ncbi:precorrin-2 methylase [Microbacterium sp. TS-1]|nr:precorrin-2 methylase [Microbacterium sp. TS-1]